MTLSSPIMSALDPLTQIWQALGLSVAVDQSVTVDRVMMDVAAAPMAST